MTTVTRRTMLSVLAAGGLLGAGLAGGAFLWPWRRTVGGVSNGGMMGPSVSGSQAPADMSTYMEMFNRHRELRRTVEEIHGGVRTRTEADSPDLVAQLQAHVASMYDHLDQGREVTCMSNSLPVLFRNAKRYHRALSVTPKGVAVTETSTDPALTRAIRDHAREVTGFVSSGMPAMMGAGAPMMQRPLNSG
jgi:hypothetical protein